MSSIEEALSVPANPGLSDFENLPVRQAGVEIPGAAGGLREAMKIEPQEFHMGDEGTIALNYKVQKVRFEPIDKDDPEGDQRRVHVFAVTGAAFVDSASVQSDIDAQTERIRLAKEKAQGVARLPLDPPDENQLLADHEAGDHAEGLVAGCPSCDLEVDLEAQGE